MRNRSMGRSGERPYDALMPYLVISCIGFAGAGVTQAQARAPDLDEIEISRAETQPAPLTLDEAVRSAVHDNAQLGSERATWQAMQERPAQAATLSDPMFVYSGMDMASGGHWPNSDEKRFMVQQEFPWFGKLDLRQDIARKDAETAQWQVETATQDVVMSVKETYFSLYSVQHSIAITRAEGNVIRRMESVAQTMYATGDRPQTDVLKAQTEITMLQQRLLELQTQEATLEARINTLMNRPAEAPLGELATAPQDATPDVAALPAMAAASRPEIRAAQAQIERYELETKLMEKDFAPDYRLGVEYRSFRQGDNMLMFTVGITLPLWQSKYRAGVREAETMRNASRMAREAALRQTSFDVQDASFKLLVARRTLGLYKRELVPQAAARFDASEAGYRTGKVDFLDLLESERFLLNARLMAATAEGDLGIQVARLERAVGRELKPAAASTGPSVEEQGVKNDK